jgi:hypothetical protein
MAEVMARRSCDGWVWNRTCSYRGHEQFPREGEPLSDRTRDNILHGVIFLLLVILICSPPIQRTVREKLEQFAPPNVAAATVSTVWVYKENGLYFCPDSQFYGKFKPGVYMIQEKALQRGYQPAGQRPCR